MRNVLLKDLRAEENKAEGFGLFFLLRAEESWLKKKSIVRHLGEVTDCLLTGPLQRKSLAATSSQCEVALLPGTRCPLKLNPLLPQEFRDRDVSFDDSFQRDDSWAQEEDITRL